MKPVRALLVLVMPLLLSGCFLIPGLFTSTLDLRKDGAFTFTYKGQIVFASPDDLDGKSQPKMWSEKMAKCYTTGRTYLDEYAVEMESTVDVMSADETSDEKPRKCTATELATLKKEFDDNQSATAARKKKEAAEMAQVFGLGPTDDELSRKIAANLMKYEGWKSVIYRGKGVYDVDYQLSGRIGHDFIFPIFPQGDILIPFVTVRGREAGSVFISAPALAGGGFKGLAARAKMLGAVGAGSEKMPQTSVVTKGRFTVTTEGAVLTNNTADGPVAGTAGQTLVWDIDNSSEKIPEALIKLR